MQSQTDGAIAQSVEQRTENPCVPGSNPGGTTSKSLSEMKGFFGLNLFIAGELHLVFISNSQFCFMQKPTDDIVTSRLILRLMDEAVISNCLKKNLEGAAHLLKARVPVVILDYPTILQYAIKQFKEDESYLPWAARAIILPEANQMVGLVRFHSQPNPEYLKNYASNAVEFGYQIFKDYRKNGYATETVIALIDWAQTTFGVVNFIASVSPDNKDSLKLILGLGFKKIGEVMDDIDGFEYIFLKHLS